MDLNDVELDSWDLTENLILNTKEELNSICEPLLYTSYLKHLALSSSIILNNQTTP